jgi:peptidoglycan hydrolase-like protein with peptidoglycan-binding domain
MTAGDSKLAGVAFALVTASVAVNLLAFQETRRGAAFETSAISHKPEFGDMGRAGLVGPGAGPAETPAGALRVVPEGDTSASSAEIVRGIQRELNTRGYDAGQPDGVAGLVTRAAIMAYEFDYGFALTATPSQELLSRIVLGSSAPAANRPKGFGGVTGDAEGVVRMTEQALASLGYQPGKADGKISDQTARAIREFELDQKLPESGRVSGPLMSRLLRLQDQMAQPAAQAAAKPATRVAAKPAGQVSAKPGKAAQK